MLALLAVLSVAAGAAPSTCRMATAHTISTVRVGWEADDIGEARSRNGDDGEAHSFSIRLRRVLPAKTCIRLAWRTVPIGERPANAADFSEGKWPHGMVDLPAWPSLGKPDAPNMEIAFSPIDDHRVEPNETFAFEIIDADGHAIWGADRWKPDVRHRSVIWDNDHHRNGMVLTIHDVPRTCPQRGRGRRFEIQDWRDNPVDAKYASWPVISIVRPANEPIIQCEDVSWTIAPGGPRSLSASDFRAGHFPSGTLRFSSDSSGSEFQQDSLLLPFPVKSPKKLQGRTATIVVRSRHEIVAQEVVVLP